MYDNEFDGTAAFSGGGFMPPPAAQTADPSPSVFTEKRDAKRLLPLTVNQINDGVDVNNVKLVGMVLNKAEGSVNEIRFVLDDGTGRIDCLKWVNEPVDIKEMEPIMYVTVFFLLIYESIFKLDRCCLVRILRLIAFREGVYVRVHGQVKELQGKKHLMVFGIKPVTDFDEITVTHHFVECIDVHSYNTRLMVRFHNFTLISSYFTYDIHQR
ncbi:putative replication factor A protein [Helianthus annuus]|uniref:Replication factor A protein n=1 Tax=Helianthus annuus TaxID=4232 RepID=A0A9K3IZ95_HELAN|nr:putative replication factor A protein [Helianthus annuus]KAJ0569353.1 putative replication factor A protein [Helianthus annuus]KAJ0583663.1 putative replication factor A protein [Helianthus annuus]KAJ0746381.1 putative replication factor A protein [Helianthus annuus]KAJ0749392.1 putative replication factor A protein [Helianthus annuus]